MPSNPQVLYNLDWIMSFLWLTQVKFLCCCQWEYGPDHLWYWLALTKLSSLVKSSQYLFDQVGVNCARYVGTCLTVGLSVLAFLSPIAMVLLPKLEIMDWQDLGMGKAASECRPECEGLLISFAFKLLVLLVGAVALFFRKVNKLVFFHSSSLFFNNLRKHIWWKLFWIVGKE